MEKKLGRIENVKFGIGGYQNAMIGLHITLGNNDWGVQDSRSAWDAENIKYSKNSKWTEADRDKKYAEIVRYLSKLLKDAKVNSIDKLKGIPVEVTFEDNMLKEWRILTEVL
ncbi:MAG TPA: hypothetical protein P5513_07765 [Candidatus Diapherotrites archaeon]|nr:hypothetical protein [Candidatus Diapherotrites archaeon]